MLLLRTLAAFICSMALISAPAYAKVEVQSHSTLLAVKISEDIAPGDYERLLHGLRGHPGNFPRKIALLDSLGGSAPEAIRMGRLLREKGFDVLVPREGLCQGSCVYLLAAGVKRTINGHVALRRPPFAAGDSAQAQAAHGREPVRAAQYFRDMGVSEQLAQALYSAPAGRLQLLDRAHMRRYGLQ